MEFLHGLVQDLPGTRRRSGRLKDMSQRFRRIGMVSLAVAGLLALAWMFVVPGEVKTIVHFLRWRRDHLLASGDVARSPSGTRVHWEEFGTAKGPPVVVLHGGLSSLEFMGGQIEALAGAGYDVLAIDSRGHGRSINTAPATTYEMLTDDVAAVMDARSIARADVVGWSDGGIVGLDLARRYPTRVRRVVAFGANHTPAPDGEDTLQTQAFHAASFDAPSFAPARIVYQSIAPDPGAWSGLFERDKAMIFSGPNWSLAELAAIRAPVLLENGEHDLVLLPYATAMKEAIPGARLVVVPGEGHRLPLASPGKANPIMLDFLSQ
jgi:pimeloyl-ACP methyl ester carboxylesterase